MKQTFKFRQVPYPNHLLVIQPNKFNLWMCNMHTRLAWTNKSASWEMLKIREMKTKPNIMLTSRHYSGWIDIYHASCYHFNERKMRFIYLGMFIRYEEQMIIQIHDGLKETWTDVKGIKIHGYIPVTTVPFESLYWRNMELLSKIFHIMFWKLKLKGINFPVKMYI